MQTRTSSSLCWPSFKCRCIEAKLLSDDIQRLMVPRLLCVVLLMKIEKIDTAYVCCFTEHFSHVCPALPPKQVLHQHCFVGAPSPQYFDMKTDAVVIEKDLVCLLIYSVHKESRFLNSFLTSVIYCQLSVATLWFCIKSINDFNMFLHVCEAECVMGFEMSLHFYAL